MNLNSNFLRLTAVIYVFVYRDRMFGFGSSFLWLVSHCGIMVLYIVKLIQKGICHQALNDLTVPNLALPQRWQIRLIGTVRIFSLGLTRRYKWDAMHSAIRWRAHYTGGCSFSNRIQRGLQQLFVKWFFNDLYIKLDTTWTGWFFSYAFQNELFLV